MIKKIRQVTNNSIGVTFTKEEREIYGIEVGGKVNMTDAIFLKQKEAEENLRDCMAKTQNAKRLKELKKRIKGNDK